MKFPPTSVILLFLTLAVFTTACVQEPVSSPALKTAFKNNFLIGAALNPAQFCESNAAEAALVKVQFNSITPENVMKWEKIHPEPGQYDFTLPDDYVAFGVKNKMFIIGHTLVWHSQTPDWVFRDDQGNYVDRDTLLARMREHIFTIIGRYKGKISGWDVVNEALNDNGTLRDSPWRKIIGDDFIAKAFEFAHQADPKAELYYNDYSLENPPKRAGALALVQKLQAQGVKINAVGIQEHINLDWPAIQLVDDTVTELGQLGIQVNITELDVDVLPVASSDNSADVSRNITGNPTLNPYTNGLPDSVQQTLARRYAELFAAYQRHPNVIGRVTFWGVTDTDSWLNSWPIRGRTNYPLLFDREGKPKPAFTSVLQMSHVQPSPPSNLTVKQP